AQASAGRLDRLRLIGIGAAIEADGNRRMARTFFVEPISSTVLASYKEWDFGDDPAPNGEAIGKLFASSRRPLGELASGYHVVRGARRRESGLLDLDRARSIAPSNPPGALWGELRAPLLVRDLTAHAAELERGPPQLL